MNRLLHLRGEHVVHHPVALDLILPLKQWRNNLYSVMTTPGSRASMTDVERALILDFDQRGRQRPAENVFNSFLGTHFFA
jgi:hypothetical protein